MLKFWINFRRKFKAKSIDTQHDFQMIAPKIAQQLQQTNPTIQQQNLKQIYQKH